jgi:hypothetical protein
LYCPHVAATVRTGRGRRASARCDIDHVRAADPRRGALPFGTLGALQRVKRSRINGSSSSREIVVTYTYYDYLELAPGASPARIEAAYVHLLERFGFRKSGSGHDFSGLVRMIHAAHEVLSNPAARHAYDEQLQREAARAEEELRQTLDQRARPLRRAQDMAMPLSGFPGALGD